MSVRRILVASAVVLAVAGVAWLIYCRTELVRCTRVGGFAGVNDTLVVQRGGRLTLTRKDGSVLHYNATWAGVESIQRSLASPQFKSALGTYSAPGADRYRYTITAKGKTISTMQGAPHPVAIHDLVATLDGMMTVR